MISMKSFSTSICTFPITGRIVESMIFPPFLRITFRHPLVWINPDKIYIFIRFHISEQHGINIHSQIYTTATPSRPKIYHNKFSFQSFTVQFLIKIELRGRLPYLFNHLHRTTWRFSKFQSPSMRIIPHKLVKRLVILRFYGKYRKHEQ